MRKYSDSAPDLSVADSRGDSELEELTLAVDTSSPRNSLALAEGGRLLATATFSGGRNAPPLLAEISRLLESADRSRSDLNRLIATRGPGSFTGLRSGLSTVLGLHQALEIPATALSSFVVLANSIAKAETVVAVIDALRGEWYVQRFGRSVREPVSPPAIVATDELASWAPSTVVSFDAARLQGHLGLDSGLEFHQPRELATSLVDLAGEKWVSWNPDTLIRPLYLRPPAAAVSSPRLPQDGL